MYPTQKAQQEGYDQVLWTDPITHQWVEETGTTNLFAVIENTVVTPSLTNTLLAGITRDSVITGLRHLGYTVEERQLSVQELKDAIAQKTLKEMFITGTAATLISIQGFGHKDEYFEVLDNGNTATSSAVKSFLDSLRYGNIDDPFGWTVSI